MFKRLLLTLALLTLAVPSLQAQDQATRVYVAYYQISYGDMEEWIESYNRASVPVLEALVEEGVINGFGMRMHSTGGEYNIRFVAQGDDDTNFGAFWSQYLGRLNEADPVGAERTNRMIQAHEDEIWHIDELVLAEGGGGAKYFYDAQFVVNFADLGAWNEMFAETFRPALDEAMAEGLLQGWVVESHDTGGRFNFKLITMVDDWDNIDDVTGKIFASAPLSHPIWSMFSAHKDEVWESFPPSG